MFLERLQRDLCWCNQVARIVSGMHYRICSLMQSVLHLRRFALRNFARTKYCNKVHNLRLARHLNANSLILNLSQSLKPGEVNESVRLCFGMHSVKDFAVFRCLYVCFISGNKTVRLLISWPYFRGSILSWGKWEFRTLGYFYAVPARIRGHMYVCSLI
jgi:hypothetical protein